jgi:hypothetical protein
VQPRCTCGALLPEDARFCHKCGKPQYEEDIARLSSVEPTVEAVRPSEPAPFSPPSRIGFRNLRAVGITLVVAAVSLVALGLAAQMGPSPLGLIILCAAGFAAARFYHRRTSEQLTPLGGATLGAMTFLWLFLVAAAGAVIMLSTPDGRETFRAGMPNVPELTKVLNDPNQFVTFTLVALAVSFFIGTVAAAAGGMLAARLLPRSGQSS